MKSGIGKLIFVGIKGTVVALDRATGATVWATKVKGSDFVNLHLDGDTLLATSRGEVFCLDPQSGQVRWSNPMPGYGWGLITVASPGGAPMNTPALAEYLSRALAEATASSPTPATFPMT